MKQSKAFLLEDFKETYQQLRHYDKNIMVSFKLVFTIYIAVLGATTSLYETGFFQNQLMLFRIILLLMYFFVFAISLYILGTRKYFVRSARYLNEIRGLHLRVLKKKGYFLNYSKYFTNMNHPSLWHWKSSHAILFIILFLFNVFGLILCLHLFGFCISWILILTVLASALQLLLFRSKIKERKNSKV